MNGIHEVTGSIPVWSTNSKALRLKIEIANPHRWPNHAAVWRELHLGYHERVIVPSSFAGDDRVARPLATRAYVLDVDAGAAVSWST